MGFRKAARTVIRRARWNLLEGVFPPSEVSESDLEPGAHIFVHRETKGGSTIYTHHGIYIGNGMVVQFDRDRSGGSVKSRLSLRSVSRMKSREPGCTEWGSQDHDGVYVTCLACFLSGGRLRLYEYLGGQNVRDILDFVFSLGDCTMAESDPPDEVIRRANYLLEHGFGVYQLLDHNCENFATYCKTGLVNTEGPKSSVGWSLQTQGKQMPQSMFGLDMYKVPVEKLALYMAA